MSPHSVELVILQSNRKVFGLLFFTIPHCESVKMMGFAGKKFHPGVKNVLPHCFQIAMNY